MSVALWNVYVKGSVDSLKFVSLSVSVTVESWIIREIGGSLGAL